MGTFLSSPQGDILTESRQSHEKQLRPAFRSAMLMVNDRFFSICPLCNKGFASFGLVFDCGLHAAHVWVGLPEVQCNEFEFKRLGSISEFVLVYGSWAGILHLLP